MSTPERLLEKEVWRLLAALTVAASELDSAADDVDDWGGYASNYSRQKHDLSGNVEHIRNCATTARAALAASKEQKEVRAKREWLPIESAPKDGTCIIVYDAPHQYVMQWIECYQFWSTPTGLINTRSATHWQSLPEPPIDAAKEQAK